MSKLQPIKHTVNNQEYEIQSLPTIEGIVVAIFKDGKRISPRYSVTWESHYDMAIYTEKHGHERLIEIAKSDLDQGIIK